MNRRMLPKLAGQHVKLRPHPLIDTRRGWENLVYEDWFVKVRGTDRSGLELSQFPYSIELSADHIREYLTDPVRPQSGFLLLKSQLFLKGTNAWFEPLAHPASNKPAGDADMDS